MQNTTGELLSPDALNSYVSQAQQLGGVAGIPGYYVLSPGVQNQIKDAYSAWDIANNTTTGGTVGGTTGGTDITNAINNSFDTQISGLNDLLGALGGQRNNATTKVNNLFSNNQSRLNATRDSNLAQLQSDRDRTQRDLDTGNRRLGEVGRQALQGFNNQLGTLGAGSSSAALLGAEAIGRDQTRLRSDLFNQAQDRFNNLDMQTSNVTADYDLAIQELNTWKNNNILDITEQYQTLQRQIRQEMATADAQRQLALAEMSMDIANQAASQIQAVQGDYQNAVNSYGGVTGPTAQLGVTSSQYNPLTVNPNQLQGSIVVNGQGYNQNTSPRMQGSTTQVQAPSTVRQRDLNNTGLNGLVVNG